jgi:hypothetical protein
MSTRLLTYADRWRLGVIFASAAIFATALPFTALRLDWSSFASVYLMGALLAAVGLTYRVLGRDESIAATVFIVAQIVVYSNLAVLDNYAGLELRRPLIDPLLASVDRAMGLDWWGYVVWVKSIPVIGRLLSAAYLSSLAQVAVVIIILGFTRRFERLDRFTLAFMFSSALTIALWTLFPNFGALAFHYAQGLAEPNFELVVTKEEAFRLYALYASPPPLLKLSDLTGLIGCPSFHTALAILSIYALWGVPYAGPLAIVVNILVFASIPADGGHHFIDLAGGAIVTALALYLSNTALRRNAAELAAAARQAPVLPSKIPA